MKDNKLVVTKYRNYNAAFLFNDGDIDELILSKDMPFNVGDIYVGRVSSVKDSLKACFVTFKEDCVGFLPFEEIYPQCLLSRKYDGRLVQGDLVCVEVIKEPMKTKGATLSMRLTVSGSLCVVTLDDRSVHVSSKIGKKQAGEFKDFFSKNRLNHGLVVRTNSIGADASEVYAEGKRNSEILSDIVSVMNSRSLYSCLYRAKPGYVQRIRSIKTNKYSEIITDNEDIYEDLKEFDNLRLYKDEHIPLKAVYAFDRAYDTATSKKVNLNFGGYLVIEPTEALTVIDVNSGKFSKNLSKRDAILKVNAEAAKEIARQLRLRNISGIIIVDFINISGPDAFDDIREILRNEFKKDYVKTNLCGFTNLDLAEISREKKFSSIYDVIKGEDASQE